MTDTTAAVPPLLWWLCTGWTLHLLICTTAAALLLRDPAPHPEPTARCAGPAQPRGPAPTAFISYAHDSPDHKAAVLALATTLESCGITTVFDQWDTDVRRDWSSWAIGGLSTSDYVLVVASPAYRAAGDGLGCPQVNRGVHAETAVLRDLLHGDRATWLPRLLPVVLPGGSPRELPHFLQPHVCDHYVVDEISPAGLGELLRVLTRRLPAEVRVL